MLILVIFLLLVYILFKLCIRIKEEYTQKNLRNHLAKVIRKFNEKNIDYWADYGTLLGMIRENDIIRHDNDTDICLFPNQENIEQKLKDVVQELGSPYNLAYYPKDNNLGLYRIYSSENILLPIYTDIYVTRLKDEYYEDISGKLHKNLLGNTRYINWNSVKVRIPENVHETLVWRYGENYMTPIKGVSNSR